MIPTHHLPEDILAVYAAGSCSEPEALFVASHLTLCASCRETLAFHEAVGGAAIDDAAPVPVSIDPASICSHSPVEPSAKASSDVERELAEAGLPKTLAPYMPQGLRWRFLAPGVKYVRLSVDWAGNPTRLVRFPPGYVVPLHTHVGPELTLVLRGSLRDGDAIFCRGDVEVCDDSHRHELRITKDGECICLFVSDAAPVPLTWLGRLLRPFLG